MFKISPNKSNKKIAPNVEKYNEVFFGIKSHLEKIDIEFIQ